MSVNLCLRRIFFTYLLFSFQGNYQEVTIDATGLYFYFTLHYHSQR